ncbi:4d02eded-7eb9-4f7f-9943-741b74605947 [Thermothielavioides terrestris]|uniref:4d02eded-7eb9-4f7f-9943-741b74605947 n=1 Tax=Thermothielavioides terrestris TaxID=2587410 RepID=A0A446BHR3_9PEZI|nr:4d02eded-7eb9-4f7f-9943-741b74605947 [Thermothielavioides terrestris]
MWAGNLGAHQRGRASLDYRLREAPHLQEQVVYLLKDLSQSLQDAVSMVCREERRSHLGIGAQPEALDIKQQPLHSSYDPERRSEDSFSGSDDDEAPLQNGPTELCVDVAEAIDCLLRLSVAIANPAPHERARVGDAEDVSIRETYDIRYVQEKFPMMDPALSGVLGKAITRRRQFFRYREAHHAKLAAGLERLGHDGNAKDTGQTEIVPKTVASSLPSHFKELTGIDLRTSVFDEDRGSETGMSQTSYATSAGFIPEEVDGQPVEPPAPLKVPPLPAAAQHGSFECPFCYRMVSASTRSAWKRHVFGDLRPYTCLFPECAESHADFDRRHLWEAHISQHHWQSFYCPFTCDTSSPSASELRQHLSHQHMPGATAEQLNAVLSLGKRAAAADTANECPMCRHTVIGLRPYIRHVGRHLEQLALFALPHLEDENHSEGGRSDQESGTSSCDDEIHGADNDEPHERTEPIELARDDLGQDDISTLETVNNLGNVYRKRGRLTEAESMFQRALEGQENALGRDHPSTLQTVHNLGIFYANQGRLTEAESMFQWALEGQEKALAQDDVSTLDTVCSLGSVYWKQGRLTEAESMYQRALEGYKKALGRDHPSTLQTVHNVGIFYGTHGRLTEAESMFQWALEGREKALGRDHLSTLETVYNLGIVYENQGRLMEAESMFQWALKGREKALGPDHLSTLSTVNNLGIVYENQGRLMEAESMFQRALEGREKALGRDHPSTLETVHSLAVLYATQGELTEAESMYQRALRSAPQGPDQNAKRPIIATPGHRLSDRGSGNLSRDINQSSNEGQHYAQPASSSPQSRAAGHVPSSAVVDEEGDQSRRNRSPPRRGALNVGPRPPVKPNRPFFDRGYYEYINPSDLAGYDQADRAFQPGHNQDEDVEANAPPGAKWTKTKRHLVSPETLTTFKERFEVRDDFVIVQRMLSEEEFHRYWSFTAMLIA